MASSSPELKEVWLQTVTEAQPFQVYAAREPVGAFGSLMPLLLAVAVAVFHLRPGAGEKRSAWVVPAALLVMATALSFYQIRTLPFASAITIPILGAWIAEMRASEHRANDRASSGVRFPSLPPSSPRFRSPIS